MRCKYLDKGKFVKNEGSGKAGQRSRLVSMRLPAIAHGDYKMQIG
jgi:hypothetical protein